MKLLNILIFSILTLICATILNAKIYTWTDEKGVKHYSDHPPENEENYEVQREPPTYQPVEEADNVRTEAEQEQIQDFIKEVDEIYEEQQQEEKLKAEEAEINRPPTQEDKIAAEKEKLEKKIAYLKDQPLSYFGSNRLRRRHIGFYRDRLKTLQQDPDEYFKNPKDYRRYIEKPE
jgi:hypothetical protein